MNIEPVMTDSLYTQGLKKGYKIGIEDAVRVVHGEIEVYEDQSARVNPTRLKKIQRRWFKLKEIENRIRQLLSKVVEVRL